MRSIIKNKKAQSEVISDVVAFIFILILSIAVIQLSIASRLLNNPNTTGEVKGNLKILSDRTTSYINAKLQEKHGSVLFSDFIRADNATAKQEITDNIKKICKEHNQECGVIIDNDIHDCWYNVIKPDFYQTVFGCFTIPGNKPLFLKIYTNNEDAGAVLYG